MVENPQPLEPVLTRERPVFCASEKPDAVELLREGVEQAMTSEGYQVFLTTLSRFPTYSLRNQLLIARQMPDATHVASYGVWKSLGRQVMRGERGIRIFAPITQLDPETNEREVVAFRVVSTFDYSQTEGKPLTFPPPLPELTDVNDRSREVQTRLFRFLHEDGVRVEAIPIHGHARGYYQPEKKRIVIRPSEEVDPFSIGKTKTLMHEAAHYLADHKDGIDRRAAEVVAESSAYVAMHHFGLDTLPYSAPYTARWARDIETFFQAAGEIHRVSALLIAAIAAPTSFEEDAPPAAV